MTGLRHTLAALIVAAVLLAGLVACASSVTGEAQYVGAGPTLASDSTSEPTATTEETTTSATTTAETTAESTTAAEEETTTSEQTTATEEEADPDPGGAGLTEEEEFACFIVPFADVIADENYGILLDGSDPSVTRESVAQDYDDAYVGVMIFIDPLPAGPIRDASEAYAAALLDVRDGLLGGGDVSTEPVVQTKTTLLDECGLG